MPSPSSPYYLFGSQRRYPFAWHGGAGGVPWSQPAAETRELSGCPGGCDPHDTAGFSIEESGGTPFAIHYPAFNRTRIRSLGDWPAFFPAGPERLDPGIAGTLGALGDLATRWRRAAGLGEIPVWSGLSDNEKKIVMLGGAAALAWWYVRGRKRRRGRR